MTLAQIYKVQHNDDIIAERTMRLYTRAGGKVLSSIQDSYILSDVELYTRCNQKITKKLSYLLKEYLC